MIVGVGSDIVEIERISQIYQRSQGFVKRILTEKEQTYLLNKSPERVVEFLAGRFAAKEAVAKAVGSGIGRTLSFQDIEVLPDASGKPTVQLSQLAYTQNSLVNTCKIHISISHSRAFAIAHVVIEQM